MVSYLERVWKSMNIPALEESIISQILMNSYYKVSQKIFTTALKNVRSKQRLTSKLEKPVFPKSLTPELRPIRPNLQKQHIRHEYYLEESKKRQIMNKQVRVWRKRQRERQEKLQQFLSQLENIESEEKIEKAKAEVEYQIKVKDDYIQELEKMQQLKEKRHKIQEELKLKEKEYQDKIKLKPLYIRMQEHPIRRTTERDLQYRKMGKKSQSYNIPTEHQHFSSKTGARLLREDKKQLEEEEKALFEKYMLLEKRKKYSDLVKEMLVPTVDKFKQKELELRKAKLMYPLRRDNLKRSESSLRADEYDEFKPRKFPVNKMVPLPPPKRESKASDYLQQMKDRRRKTQATIHNSASPTRTVNQVKAYTSSIEKQARMKEFMIGNKRDDFKAIDQIDDINNLLIDSIKAKLSVLENIKNN